VEEEARGCVAAPSSRSISEREVNSLRGVDSLPVVSSAEALTASEAVNVSQMADFDVQAKIPSNSTALAYELAGGESLEGAGSVQ
jgi:hypothetical protein